MHILLSNRPNDEKEKKKIITVSSSKNAKALDHPQQNPCKSREWKVSGGRLRVDGQNIRIIFFIKQASVPSNVTVTGKNSTNYEEWPCPEDKETVCAAALTEHNSVLSG